MLRVGDKVIRKENLQRKNGWYNKSGSQPDRVLTVRTVDPSFLQFEEIRGMFTPRYFRKIG